MTRMQPIRVGGIVWSLLLALLVAGGAASRGGVRGAKEAPAPAPEPTNATGPDPEVASTAAWVPVEDEVDQALADTRDEVQETEKHLEYMKRFCDPTKYGKCREHIERTSARLARLLDAEKLLRLKNEDSMKIQEGQAKGALEVMKVEDQVSSLHALKKFAELSKQDVDKQKKRLDSASEGYERKMVEAGHRIEELKKDLARARDERLEAETRSLNLAAEAKGIERGVNTTDVFAEAEFARAVRKQRVAEGLYDRADAIRKHAERMIVLHHDENTTDAKKAMYGTSNPLGVSHSTDLDVWGHMLDFGGRIPEEESRPCPPERKAKKAVKPKEPEEEAEPVEVDIKPAKKDKKDPVFGYRLREIHNAKEGGPGDGAWSALSHHHKHATARATKKMLNRDVRRKAPQQELEHASAPQQEEAAQEEAEEKAQEEAAEKPPAPAQEAMQDDDEAAAVQDIVGDESDAPEEKEPTAAVAAEGAGEEGTTEATQPVAQAEEAEASVPGPRDEVDKESVKVEEAEASLPAESESDDAQASAEASADEKAEDESTSASMAEAERQFQEAERAERELGR